MLVIGISVIADRAGKNLVVQVLKVVKPPDFTSLSAVVESKVTDNIANVGVILARLDHREAKSLLVETDVLILLKKALLDTVLTIALFKNTEGSEIPAGSTVLLIVARGLVPGDIAVGQIVIIPGEMSVFLHDIGSASSALGASEAVKITSVEITSVEITSVEIASERPAHCDHIFGVLG